MTPPKRVLITGGSSGLGFRTALHLAGAGMDVVATARRGEDADRVRKTAAHAGLDITVVLLDLLDGRSVLDAVAEAARLRGGIDVLVNNAGVEVTGPLEELRPFGVAVSLIEPGRFPSALPVNRRVAGGDGGDSIYREHARWFSAALPRLDPPGYRPDLNDVAAAVRQVIDRPDPALHVPVGADAELTAQLRARAPFEPYARRLGLQLGLQSPIDEGVSP